MSVISASALGPLVSCPRCCDVPSVPWRFKGCFHARATSWGAALVRGSVRCSARSRMPFTRSSNLPEGGVIALKVCLAWYREGCVLRMVASWLRVNTWRRRCWDRVGVTHAGLHEGIERVVIAVVSAG